MSKASASFVLAAAAALAVLSQSGAVEAQPYGHYAGPQGNWIVGPGFLGFSGYPWAGPPVAWPIPKPAYGCYFTRARIHNAWRQVEVCS